MRADIRRRCAVVLALMLAGPALAAPIAWATLGSERQRLLAEFAATWATLAPAQQQQLVDNADAWARLDPLQQARLQQRLVEWQALSAVERNRLRERHAAWQRLDPAERDALSAQLQQWQALDAEARQARREAFAALSPAERRGWLLDAGTRELDLLALRLFAFVPEGEATATRAMLAALGEDERGLLEAVSRRLPPWQREALRQELLALPAAARGEALQRRSGSGR